MFLKAGACSPDTFFLLFVKHEYSIVFEFYLFIANTAISFSALSFLLKDLTGLEVQAKIDGR